MINEGRIATEINASIILKIMLELKSDVPEKYFLLKDIKIK